MGIRLYWYSNFMCSKLTTKPNLYIWLLFIGFIFFNLKFRTCIIYPAIFAKIIIISLNSFFNLQNFFLRNFRKIEWKILLKFFKYFDSNIRQSSIFTGVLIVKKLLKQVRYFLKPFICLRIWKNYKRPAI